MKKIFYPLFFILISFVVKPVFAGNDITIACDSFQCVQNPVLPLFSETNIYPGFSASQKVFINNNRNSSCFLHIKGVSENKDILVDKISLDITGINNSFSLNNFSLTNLLNPEIDAVYLGEIPKKSQYSYTWLATLNSNVDNNYANKSSNFSIDFNFSCDDEPQSPPDSDGQVAGVSSSSNTSKCTNSYPLAPTNLTANSNPDGSVSLNWVNTLSEHTGYLIAFGTSPNNYQYGAPDVGNITNYTVQSLTPGAQYCFYVRSLNGCMPGDRSSEVCVNTGSTIIPTEVIPEGFSLEVLGVDTQNNESINETSSKIDQSQAAGNILGESNTACSGNLLPILFLIALFVNILFIRRFSAHWIVLLLITVSAGLFDYIISKNSCSLGKKWLSNYFWIGSILSFLIPLFSSKKQNN